MESVLALVGVGLGGLIALVTSSLAQTRQWKRDVQVRHETQEWELAKEVRALRYAAFSKYLSACNRMNALRIKLDALRDEGRVDDPASRVEFREAVAEAQILLQEAQPVYMLVDDGGELRTALDRMAEEVHGLRKKLERFEPVSWTENEPFRTTRASCEALMGRLLLPQPQPPGRLTSRPSRSAT